MAAPTLAQPAAPDRPAPCLTETTARALATADPAPPEHRALQRPLSDRAAALPGSPRQRPDAKTSRPAELTPCSETRRTDDDRPRRTRPLARGAEEAPSERVYEHWDDWDGAWYPDARELLSYDGAGRVTEEIFQYWEIPWDDTRAEGDWVNAFRARYAYDGAGRLVQVLEAWYWEGWNEDWRATLTYDGSGRLDRIFYAGRYEGTWFTYGRVTHSYDGAAPYPSAILYQYTGEYTEDDGRGDGDWHNSSRLLFTYAAGRVTSETWQRWEPGVEAWVDEDRDLFTYDASGYLVEVIYQASFEGEWHNYLRILYTNNASGQITSAILHLWWEEWEDARAEGYWQSVLRAFVAYNTAGNWVEILQEMWVFGSEDEWVNDERGLFAYENAGTRLVEERWQYWTGGAWEDGSRVRLFYGTTSTEPGAAPLALALSAAPNPARGALRVSYKLDAPVRVRLALYDALGRRVVSLADADAPAGAVDAALDVSGLAPGVYVLRLEAGAAVATRRVTVLR